MSTISFCDVCGREGSCLGGVLHFYARGQITVGRAHRLTAGSHWIDICPDCLRRLDKVVARHLQEWMDEHEVVRQALRKWTGEVGRMPDEEIFERVDAEETAQREAAERRDLERLKAKYEANE